MVVAFLVAPIAILATVTSATARHIAERQLARAIAQHNAMAMHAAAAVIACRALKATALEAQLIAVLIPRIAARAEATKFRHGDGAHGALLLRPR